MLQCSFAIKITIGTNTNGLNWKKKS